MKHKGLLLYAWFIRTMLFFWPDIPFIMHFRGWLYSLGMKKCGSNLQIAHSAIINGLDLCNFGCNVYIANGCHFILNGDLSIGDEVIFGPNVLVSTGNHQFDGKSFRFSESKKQNVEIGSGCWVGGNCCILGGAIVPTKSIIAAGSVFTKKEYNESGIFGGMPAKYIGPIA